MATPTTPHAADAAAFESRTLREVGRRLIPFLVLCYFLAYVDRVHVGVAALPMNHDLGLSAAAFGLGGGWPQPFALPSLGGEFAPGAPPRPQLARGLMQWRIGCRFVDLPAAVEQQVMQYIFQVERQRNARLRRGG